MHLLLKQNYINTLIFNRYFPNIKNIDIFWRTKGDFCIFQSNRCTTRHILCNANNYLNINLIFVVL